MAGGGVTPGTNDAGRPMSRITESIRRFVIGEERTPRSAVVADRLRAEGPCSPR
jgi:hypothetical protein